MTQVLPPSKWPFRSTLNSSERLGVKAEPTTLAAFTPDIIPLDQIIATPNDVAASYKHFISHTIDRNEASTFIYLRAKAVDPTSVLTPPPKVDLYAMESHLVPWPHTLQRARHVGRTTLQVTPDQAKKAVAVSGPISYRPISLPGSDRHETLIAVQNQFGPGFEALTQAVKNWDDLVEHVGKSTNLAFYNVMMADPCTPYTKLTSKLDFPENKKSTVDLYIGLEAVGIPAVEARLQIADGFKTYLTIGRQPLTVSKEFGARFSLPARFSGEVTLEIFNNEEEVFGDYSSVSIALFAVNRQGGSETLLGAEHLVFDSNPRVKRLIRKYNSRTLKPDEKADASGDKPRFYFRAEIGETADTQKNGYTYFSPDIQPVGNAPVDDPESTFSDDSVDVSSNDKIGISSNKSNYIYLRGYTTIAHKGQVRLYFMPNTALLHPTEYDKTDYTATDVDPNDNTKTIVALRSYDTSTTGTEQVIFKTPFLLADLAAPPVGHDHYCLIAECKPHRTKQEIDDGVPEYKWPHEETGDLTTFSEFATWIASERRVVQRNMSFTCDNDGATWNKRQAFKLPKNTQSSDTFHYQIHAVNCPTGSEFSMDSDDASINFGRTKVTNSNQGGYSEFTGKSAGFSCQVVLHWYANGYEIQSGQTLSGQLSIYKLMTSNAAKCKSPSSESKKIKASYSSLGPKPKRRLHVGESYPNVVVSAKYRVPGRLKLGGAIKARRLTTRPRAERVKMMKASSESSSDDSTATSSGSEDVWEDLEVGRDAVYLG